MIDQSLVHVHDEVLVTTGIIDSGDLHLEVSKGLTAHLTRFTLSLVGHHTVSQVIPCKKARDPHLASLKSFLVEFRLHPSNLVHETHSCEGEAFLPPMYNERNEIILDIINDT